MVGLNQRGKPMSHKIRVLEFSNFVNRHDFIDNIVRRADPERFLRWFMRTYLVEQHRPHDLTLTQHHIG